MREHCYGLDTAISRTMITGYKERLGQPLSVSLAMFPVPSRGRSSSRSPWLVPHLRLGLNLHLLTVVIQGIPVRLDGDRVVVIVGKRGSVSSRVVLISTSVLSRVLLNT